MSYGAKGKGWAEYCEKDDKPSRRNVVPLARGALRWYRGKWHGGTGIEPREVVQRNGRGGELFEQAGVRLGDGAKHYAYHRPPCERVPAHHLNPEEVAIYRQELRNVARALRVPPLVAELYLDELDAAGSRFVERVGLPEPFRDCRRWRGQLTPDGTPLFVLEAEDVTIDARLFEATRANGYAGDMDEAAALGRAVERLTNAHADCPAGATCQAQRHCADHSAYRRDCSRCRLRRVFCPFTSCIKPAHVVAVLHDGRALHLDDLAAAQKGNAWPPNSQRRPLLKSAPSPALDSRHGNSPNGSLAPSAPSVTLSPALVTAPSLASATASPQPTS